MFEEEEKTFGGPSRSIDLTSTASILGGTQLVERAQMTFGNSAFVTSQANVEITRFLWVKA